MSDNPEPEPNVRYPWSPDEWDRLWAYKAAVAAGFYNDNADAAPEGRRHYEEVHHGTD